MGMYLRCTLYEAKAVSVPYMNFMEFYITAKKRSSFTSVQEFMHYSKLFAMDFQYPWVARAILMPVRCIIDMVLIYFVLGNKVSYLMR